VPSARTVLEVADGLRWTDPGLGASLAEHALRVAGDDAAVRTAAERSVIRSLAEVDRFDEVVSRATPLLDDAQVRGDRDDLAGLLTELAGAAIGLGDVAVAGRLVGPVRSEGLSARTVTLAGLVRAQIAAATGDVAVADRAAEAASTALLRTPEPEAGLVRRDLARARAAARRRGGQPAAALPILAEAVSEDPRADADGGRRSLLAAADEVDLLLDLDRREEALERGRTVLPDGPAEPLAVRATARIRLALAERHHLVAGAHAEAQSLARTAATDLEAAGDDAAAARAWEVVASVAERGGELGTALTAVRHGHDLDSRARDRRDPALRILTMIAAAAPDLPVVADRAAPPGPAAPDPVPVAGSSVLSEMESLLAGARSSVAGGVNGTEPLPRRRSHRRDDADDDLPTSGSEPVQEALARLLGAAGLGAVSADDLTTPPSGDGRPDESWNGACGRRNGRAQESADPGTPSPVDPGSPGSGRRSRHSAEPTDDPAAEPSLAAGPDVSLPTVHALSTASGRRAGNPASAADVGAAGPGDSDGTQAEHEDTDLPRGEVPEAGRNGRSPGLVADDRFPSVEPVGPPDWGFSLMDSSLSGEWGRPGEPDADVEIDPADPLGTSFTWGAMADRGAEAGRTNGSAAPGANGQAHQVGRSAGGGVVPPGSDRQETEPHAAEPRPEAPQGEETARRPATGPGRRASEERAVPPGFGPEDLDDELPLTLAGLLAEYHLPDVPAQPHRNSTRRTGVAAPSVRRDVSESMPGPAADPRFAAHPEGLPERPGAAGGVTQGPPRRGENGARLADLLAEAMDAFRHTGSEDGARGPGDGTARGPGVGSRPG
jgi:hypothetical protein